MPTVKIKLSKYPAFRGKYKTIFTDETMRMLLKASFDVDYDNHCEEAFGGEDGDLLKDNEIYYCQWEQADDLESPTDIRLRMPGRWLELQK